MSPIGSHLSCPSTWGTQALPIAQPSFQPRSQPENGRYAAKVVLRCDQFLSPGSGRYWRAVASSLAVPRPIVSASAATFIRRQPCSAYLLAVVPSAECTPTGLPAAAHSAQICASAGPSTGSSGSSSQPSE